MKFVFELENTIPKLDHGSDMWFLRALYNFSFIEILFVLGAVGWFANSLELQEPFKDNSVIPLNEAIAGESDSLID